MNLSRSRIWGTMSRVTSRRRSSRSRASRFAMSSAGGHRSRAGSESGGRRPLKWSLTARETRLSLSPRQTGQGSPPSPPSSPAHRPPWRSERECLGVELGKGLPRLYVRARGREPRERLARRGEQEARALSGLEGAVQRLARPRGPLEVGHDRLDVV